MSLFAEISAAPRLRRQPPSEADVDAIRQVIADVQDGFNANDADLMTRAFAHDAVAVAAHGVSLIGREAIVASHAAGVAGFLRDQNVRYDVVDVGFLTPDVAVARKTARATRPDGTVLDIDHSMTALYVLKKVDGHWWIAARQNTLVAT